MRHPQRWFSTLLLCLLAVVTPLAWATTANNSEETAEMIHQQGILAWKENQLSVALYEFSRAIDKDPTQARFYLDRGGAKIELGYYEQSLEDLDKALALEPNYKAKVYHNKGAAYDRLEQYEDALYWFREELKVTPQNPEALFAIGSVYQSLGREEEANAEYTKAIKLHPYQARFYNNRGNTYKHLDDPKTAMNDYTKAIELDPSYSDPYLNRGYLHYYYSQTPELRHQPTNRFLHWVLGTIDLLMYASLTEEPESI
ncbi:MAG: tetratricopeptide repeat protein [Vampirovibrionales bacterium]